MKDPVLTVMIGDHQMIRMSGHSATVTVSTHEQQLAITVLLSRAIALFLENQPKISQIALEIDDLEKQCHIVKSDIAEPGMARIRKAAGDLRTQIDASVQHRTAH